MNAVVGTIVEAEFSIYEKGMRKSAPIGKTKVKAVITDDACYSQDFKHWIYFKILETDNPEAYKIGKIYRKQGKNFYSAILSFLYPQDYEFRAEIKDQIKKGLLPWPIKETK